MTTIRTDRLLLETLTLDEARAITALDRVGRGWVADYPSEGDLIVAGIVCEAGEHYDESAEFGILQVRLAASGDAVGGLGFIHQPEGGAVEVGYGLAESARGQGYATEALRGLLAWAAGHRVHVVVAMTAIDNLASQRVLDRLGFTPAAEAVDEGGDDGPMLRWEHAIGV